jgi:hypothetical protein
MLFPFNGGRISIEKRVFDEFLMWSVTFMATKINKKTPPNDGVFLLGDYNCYFSRITLRVPLYSLPVCKTST